MLFDGYRKTVVRALMALSLCACAFAQQTTPPPVTLPTTGFVGQTNTAHRKLRPTVTTMGNWVDIAMPMRAQAAGSGGESDRILWRFDY